jgi:hypothetical protein
MILYVNGDSHSAGAEALNNHAFAMDDPLYLSLGRQPHPDNLRVSYGCEIANQLYAILDCDAESASSNQRIIRTTLDYINDENIPKFLIIGWATWEREEWTYDGRYYQVTAGGHDTVPPELSDKYKHWVIDQSNPVTVQEKIHSAHTQIYELHSVLKSKNIPHLFFNTFTSFQAIDQPIDWGNNYVDPYSDKSTYYNWLIDHGHKTVKPNSYHFGPEAHRAWADFLIQNYVQKLLTA